MKAPPPFGPASPGERAALAPALGHPGTGTASGWSGLDGQWSWMAAAARGAGRPQYFVDVLAPIGLTATYTLDVDGWTSSPVTRTSSLRLDWITDDNARVGVPFIRAPEHGVQVTSGVHLYQVKGRPRPMVALDKVATLGLVCEEPDVARVSVGVRLVRSLLPA